MFKMDSKTDSDREKDYKGTITLGLGNKLFSSALELAASLPAAHTLLDVGAGSGVWSVAQSLVFPGATITGLDFKEVLEQSFKVFALQKGVLPARIETIPGNFHSAEVPGDTFDRIIQAMVLHLESAADAAKLVDRYAKLIKVGGDLVVVDVFDFPGAEEGFFAYNMHLGVRTRNGKAHALSKILAWGEAAGLKHAATIQLKASGLSGLGAVRFLRIK